MRAFCSKLANIHRNNNNTIAKYTKYCVHVWAPFAYLRCNTNGQSIFISNSCDTNSSWTILERTATHHCNFGEISKTNKRHFSYLFGKKWRRNYQESWNAFGIWTNVWFFWRCSYFFFAKLKAKFKFKFRTIFTERLWCWQKHFVKRYN